ncbi:MAG TPA: universal stress protein, partial [Nocardioidaceae bacterium]
MTSKRSSRVVVGIDGTAAGLRAAAYATTEAEQRGAELLLVHAHHLPTIMNPSLASLDNEQVRDHGRIALDTAEVGVRYSHPAMQVQTLLVPGRPARAIVDQSAHADLVVVARRERKGSHIVGGRISNAVAARAHCPVVSLNHSWREDHDGRVVVGVDGSPNGRDALAYAFEYASIHHLRLAVLRSWELPLFLQLGEPASAEIDEWTEKAKLALAEDLAGWRSEYPDIQVLPHV